MIKLLALLISLPAFAAQPGAVPSVTLSAPGANTGSVSITPGQLSGPCTTSSSSKCFSLYCLASTTGTNQFFPCYYNGVIYKVGNATGSGSPAAYCFDITAESGSASGLFQLVSTATIFAANASSITSGTYQGGAAAAYPLITNITTSVPGIIPGVYSFANLTYPGLQVAANFTIQLHMDCFEQ